MPGVNRGGVCARAKPLRPCLESDFRHDIIPLFKKREITVLERERESILHSSKGLIVNKFLYKYVVRLGFSDQVKENK